MAKAALVGALGNAEPVVVSFPLKVAIVACLLGVVVMGLWPRPVVQAAESAAGWLIATR